MKRHDACRPQAKATNWQTTAEERLALVLANYGETCSCCGYERKEVLVVASVDEGHKRVAYHALIASNYPPGFATFCGNCQLSRNRYNKCILHGGADAA